jgi:hypothetical protein
MSDVPKLVQSKLNTLMGLLIKKGYVEHPQISISAIQDAAYDTIPLQVSQFESGIEIDDHITNLLLLGGGGGNTCESYDLAMYFLSFHYWG